MTNRKIYEQAVLKLVPSAKKRLWIATADIKDMYVEKQGLSKQMVPFLQILAELLQRRVEIRLIHAKEPGTEETRGLASLHGYPTSSHILHNSNFQCCVYFFN